MTKAILKEYENQTFDIHSSIELLEHMKEQYEIIKSYLEKKITIEELLEKVDGSCPINSCYWCNNNCTECDLIINSDGDRDCAECWIRCLNKEL